jgi:hypothetical protein
MPAATTKATPARDQAQGRWCSSNTADDEVVRVPGSLAGFEPRIVHRADSLELVQDMIVAHPASLPGLSAPRPAASVCVAAE